MRGLKRLRSACGAVTTKSAWMLIHGIGSQQSLLNSPTPSEPHVYSVVLVLSPVNATDPIRVWRRDVLNGSVIHHPRLKDDHQCMTER
jgi:hypothetical protein